MTAASTRRPAVRASEAADRPRLVRAGLLALALPQAVVGVWAAIPPFFFHDFPTASAGWIERLGAYNPHLSFDFGVSALALALLLAAAALTLRRELVVTALLAYLTWSIPHLVYHLATAHRLSTAGNVVNLAVLATSCLLPVALLAATLRVPRRR